MLEGSDNFVIKLLFHMGGVLGGSSIDCKVIIGTFMDLNVIAELCYYQYCRHTLTLCSTKGTNLLLLV